MKSLLIDIYSSLDSWGFKNVFLVNSHGDWTHKKMIEKSIEETKDALSISVYNLETLDAPVENPPVFPTPRENRYQPDYHAGAIETACMHTFYPHKVNVDVAKSLKPQDGFHPLGYCGDPASFDLEKDIIDFFEADLETDSLKIEAVLRNAEESC
jgi:creatinine amidohydrolase